jgi:hypothetical protein
MGHNAVLNSNPLESNQLWVYSPSIGVSWDLGGNGQAGVGGSQGLGMRKGPEPTEGVDVSLAIFWPATHFGGWFATHSDGGNLQVAFYGQGGGQIGATQEVSTSNGDLAWFGWESTEHIYSIRFTGNWAPAMDDLTAITVPEPATCAGIAAGLGWLCWRARRTTR